MPKQNITMGRNKLPKGERKETVQACVKSKAIEKIGYKKCAEIAVTAIEEEYLKLKEKTHNTNKCEKCGGRTALISGQWHFNPDPEPYLEGKIEGAETNIDEAWISGKVCDDCNHIQSLIFESE